MEREDTSGILRTEIRYIYISSDYLEKKHFQMKIHYVCGDYLRAKDLSKSQKEMLGIYIISTYPSHSSEVWRLQLLRKHSSYKKVLAELRCLLS